MRGRLRIGGGIGSLAALASLGALASCSHRNLDPGGASFVLDGGRPGDAVGTTDVAGSDASTAADATGGGGGAPGVDAGGSPCVTGTVQLPWTTAASAVLRLDVATTTDAVAAISRQAKQTDVRTYGRDGAVIAGFQFGADAQFVPYDDSRFLLVTHGTTGDFVATALSPDLVHGTRLYTATANATEHLLDAVVLSSTSIVLISDEHFVNIATGAIVPWSTVLGTADRDAFKSGRIYGAAARSDRLLIAWGASNALHVAVVDAAGNTVARSDDASYLGYLGSETTTAIPYDTGLLMFDGNPVRATQIGFDLSRVPLGENTQLPTFYRSVPLVAAVTVLGRPVAFWLTVFPGADNTQGSTPHQLYGCQLDIAALPRCQTTPLIAATGLGGYAVAQQPVAAAAFVDGSFAIAHTDADGQSWLRMANLDCGRDHSVP
jgi:hypothetical protein